ncbi:hypothetical protein AcV5_002893, partial [Taiwanofungus camphoratus]
ALSSAHPDYATLAVQWVVPLHILLTCVAAVQLELRDERTRAKAKSNSNTVESINAAITQLNARREELITASGSSLTFSCARTLRSSPQKHLHTSVLRARTYNASMIFTDNVMRPHPTSSRTGTPQTALLEWFPTESVPQCVDIFGWLFCRFYCVSTIR